MRVCALHTNGRYSLDAVRGLYCCIKITLKMEDASENKLVSERLGDTSFLDSTVIRNCIRTRGQETIF